MEHWQVDAIRFHVGLFSEGFVCNRTHATQVLKQQRLLVGRERLKERIRYTRTLQIINSDQQITNRDLLRPSRPLGGCLCFHSLKKSQKLPTWMAWPQRDDQFQSKYQTGGVPSTMAHDSFRECMTSSGGLHRVYLRPPGGSQVVDEVLNMSSWMQGVCKGSS